MNFQKRRWILILIIVSYLLAGTIYHFRAVKCFEIRVARGADPSGNPRGVVGWTFSAVAWPPYLMADFVNKVGVFECY